MTAIPAELITFLADLAANNDREWFQANKKRYERDLKKPALAFIDAFADPLQQISPHFQAIPKASGGSLFRIFRDTRFSKDKTPYKKNTGMHFRHEDAGRDAHTPGFYLHIQPDDSGVGVGIWMPDNTVLGQLRDKIVAEPERWTALKTHLASKGLQFMDSDKDLKRVPRGYDKNHEHARDLRRKSIAVHKKLSDAEVTAPDFQSKLASTFEDGAPLVEFVCEALGLAY